MALRLDFDRRCPRCGAAVVSAAGDEPGLCGRCRPGTTRLAERVCWRDVVRVLPDPETRSAVVASLRASGFDPDSFARRIGARRVVADALTRTEDALELAELDAGGSGRGRRREILAEQRAAIRELRRRLEGEVS